MQLILDFTGDIAERQELLNGSQTVTLEGATADGAWTLTALVSWNIGLRENTGEGDFTLARADGAEIFGSLVAGDVVETSEADAASADHVMRLEYEIDGGSGEFADVSGSATAEGTLGPDGFNGRWDLDLEGHPANRT